MMSLRTPLLFAAPLLLLASCAPRTPAASTPWHLDGNTARLAGAGVAFTFSDEWRTTKRGNPNHPVQNSSLTAEWLGPRWGSQYSPVISVGMEAVPEGTTLEQYLVDGLDTVRITPDRPRPAGDAHLWGGFPLLVEMQRRGWQLEEPEPIEWNGRAALETRGYLPFDKLHLVQRSFATSAGIVTVAATWRDKQQQEIRPEIDAVLASLHSGR